MRKFFNILLVSFLTLFVSSAYAILDPVGWSLVNTVPAQSTPNQSYSFHYQFNSNFPYVMPTPLYITTQSSSNEFVVTDQCNGKKLGPRTSCTVSVIFLPKTEGVKNFTLFMEYGKNKVPLPTVSSRVTTPASQVQAVVSLPFPSSILSNTTYYIGFTFTNTGNTPVSNVSVTGNANNTPGFTVVSNTCASTLAAGDSCVVSGSFMTAETSGAVVEGLTFTSSAGVAKVSTGTIINNTTGAQVRNFTLVNKCLIPVSFGFNGGAIPNSPTCSSDAGCPHGSRCNSTTKACYYTNPVPVNGQYTLAPNASSIVTITDFSNLSAIWSGGIAGRTGCGVTGACETADCGSNGANKACPVGQGFANPATLAEMTLERTITDTYDITAINGVNVGVSMGPTNNTPASTQPYICGNPGGAIANNVQMGNCDWNLSAYTPVPASTYVYVKDTTGATCSTTSPDCSGFAGTVCGLSFNAPANTLTKKCGKQLGFLNANQICSFAHTNFNYPNNGLNPGDAYFNCDSQLMTPASLMTYSELSMYACKTPNAAQSPLNSCYKNYGHAVDDCCGCVDWWNVSGVVVPQSATQSCGSNSNSFWTGTVQATISWLKRACPTMYTYQYDDASSKFTCSNIGGSGKNTVNYTITFCPV